MAQLLAVEADKLIGQRIQQKRKEMGFSAEKLAEYIDLSQQQLSRYERGASKINVAHLIDIAIFLKTPISWFFQDCFPNESLVNNLSMSESDQKWAELSELQKGTFIAFLETVRK
ncbi:transcriptional regulator [Actinobacillus succinogenes]|uniref:Transcriptional regulator, XRE family n=1 Tax=Actinobacillus succinogenes (strain ATCC 55618 / DSM 22257 / CCUG 43843 / 130Z) TaxID=339671 RepID=A6VQZ9_ACTSZ|nr:helix-turn-helix transcriptional regulator [Actinobacillus succinogenes]ABR75396.1 transcriptional regulator, XRE family [Actinobacillus succinogenes 130Z]PHI40216.1 transcriptional regulator [Actinobacillus succinogenes]